ncbi:asparagine synthase-related protein [Virgibacillus oceani]|uniref:asparagine synthase (glutamine-hydrolyzing) n=1 Tax=Virgibacillus oceani TaxID=1479511 RepID=A0A917HBB6_9BACI|nr:asparagine synthase-related protein [Virgibacillus oceani]GGG73243.1 hypothetical protein GCM10011398_17060 [Virgibacillus oceani]
MRKYLGEFCFEDAISTNKVMIDSISEKIDSKFQIDYKVDSNDLYITDFPNLGIVLIVDGEVYNNDLSVSINNLAYLEQVIKSVKDSNLDILNDLNGSFNLILYDYKNNELKIITDRFLTRPLYYFSDDKKIIFSNRLTEIAKYVDLEPDINYKAVAEFFSLQMVFGTKTFLNKVSAFEKATFTTISNSELVSYKYWTYKQNIDNNFRKKDYISSLSMHIKEIVEFKTKDNYKYGIFLSGGMDSRAIMAGDTQKKISEVYTLGDSYNIECRIAKTISDYKEAQFNFIQRDKDHYYTIINDSVEIGDGMYNYLNGHFIGYFDQISKNVDVIFNGSLIEQIWQGTKFINKNIKVRNYKLALPFLSRRTNSVLETISNNFPRKIAGIDKIFNRELDIDTDAIIKETFSDMLFKNFKTTQVNHQEAIDYLACDSYGRYNSHLNQLCINNEIKYRTIYDNRIIDLMLKVPVKYRSNGTLLRKSITQMDPELGNIPVANSRLSLKRSYIFHWITTTFNRVFHKLFKSKNYKSENSSWPNYSKLIIENKKIQDRILNILNNKEVLRDEMFNRDYLLKLFEEHLQGKKNHERILFSILTFGEWYKMLQEKINK